LERTNILPKDTIFYEQSNGKTIFPKLRSHLESYKKTVFDRAVQKKINKASPIIQRLRFSLSKAKMSSLNAHSKPQSEIHQKPLQKISQQNNEKNFGDQTGDIQLKTSCRGKPISKSSKMPLKGNLHIIVQYVPRLSAGNRKLAQGKTTNPIVAVTTIGNGVNANVWFV
jgi:hypothetical protein